MLLLTTFLTVLSLAAATLDFFKPPVSILCISQCKPTCANPNPKNCKIKLPVCNCKSGQVWSNCKGGKCIPISDCPKDVGCNGDKNAVIKQNVRSCLSTCDKPNIGICDKKVQLVGCVCKPGYILSKSGGKCVKPEQCSCGNPCGVNGTFVDCAFDCPSNVCPQTDSRGIILCKPPKDCPSGCACKNGYVRASPKDRKCIKPQDCKPVKCTRQNEEWYPCPGPCYSDSCDNVLQPNRICHAPINPICRPQCLCAKGYGRNDKGECVPIDQCRTNYCNDKCKPTCANPNPKNCTVNSICNCKIGEVWSSSKNGKCIPINQCPKDIGCNGDKNAVIKQNVPSCVSTCDKPDVGICDKKVQIVGCVCKPGYILSKISGECIKPEKCSCGNPCGVNGTYVNCAFDCPSNVCPQTDSRGIALCLPPVDCPPGCACKYGYIRAGPKDRRCIEPQECKPVKCTRQNEVWDRCGPDPCSTDSCEDVLKPKPVCNTLVKPVCRPQCYCAKGYGRNDKDVCVPIDQCRTKYCNDKCKPTCANPNPKNCTQDPVCSCKIGEIWSSSKDGKCIPINKCPKDVSCNGDENAVIKENVRSCVSTCDKPDVAICDKKLQLVGCVCKPGFILSKEGGKCIKPEQCSCGNPCGANSTYVSCAFDCPSNVCPQDDSGQIAVCGAPKDCPSGCACKYGYVRASPKDRKCIEPQDCQPVKCTRCNEVWDRCPQPCFSDICEDVLYPKPVCQTFVKPVCSPQCVCAKGYGRDDNGECVSIEKCKEICS